MFFSSKVCFVKSGDFRQKRFCSTTSETHFLTNVNFLKHQIMNSCINNWEMVGLFSYIIEIPTWVHLGIRDFCESKFRSQSNTDLGQYRTHYLLIRQNQRKQTNKYKIQKSLDQHKKSHFCEYTWMYILNNINIIRLDHLSPDGLRNQGEI